MRLSSKSVEIFAEDSIDLVVSRKSLALQSFEVP
jgi:hypothetical protein